jgi:hypothetical protein
MEYKIENGKLIINIASLMNTLDDVKKPITRELDEEYLKYMNNRILNEKIDSLNKKINEEKEDSLNKKINEEKEDKKFSNIKDELIFDLKSEQKNPNRFNTGQLLITMPAEERQDFDQISDIDAGIYGYDRIRIFDSMGRKSDKVHLINDGPDVMYALLNRTGVDDDTGIWTHQSEEELEKNWVTTEDKMKESWSSNETMIYPGEKWTFFDVYEIRVRSATQGNKYRVTEDDVVGNTIRQVM